MTTSATQARSLEETKQEIIVRFVEEALDGGRFDVVDETRGHFAEQAKARIRAWRDAFPDFATSIEQVVAEGDWLAARLKHTGTHRGQYLGIAPTGRRVTFTSLVFNRVEGGVVVENFGLHDHDAIRDQLQAPQREEPPPHEIVWALTNAVVPSMCLHLVAELGVADRLGDDPASPVELASRCGVEPDPLERMLALLACHGIFRREGERYAHTPASRLLRSDEPMSMRAFPRMMGLPLIAATFANLEHSVRTGRPAVETVEPNGFWTYLQDHPDEGQIFAQAMTAKASADIAAILGAYDFGACDTIVDVGGGRGHLLAAVLEAVPRAQGILFELPEVVEKLEVRHDRLTTLAGDFFADPLPAADAYVLMEVLHDWGDAECAAILSAIRRAASPGAKVLVIENVLVDRGADPRGHTLDVIMLAVTGGRERTVSELDSLFRRAGFSEGAVTDTAGPLRIVEATAV